MPVTPMGILLSLFVVMRKTELVADVVLHTNPTSVFGRAFLCSNVGNGERIGTKVVEPGSVARSC
jgi:hypothetical protein